MQTINLYHSTKRAYIDDADAALVRQYKRWRLHSQGYAVHAYTNDLGKRIYILMHRLIANPSAGFEVDHKNMNKLDNRRKNLRVCTKGQNRMNEGLRKDNSTGYRGVSLHVGGLWRARVTLNKKEYISYHKTKTQAIRAVKRTRRELFGNFARIT